MLTKLNSDGVVLEASVAENLADILFEIGRDLLGRQLLVQGVGWLEKAYDVLMTLGPQALRGTAQELLSSILQSLVQGHTMAGDQNSISRAWTFLQNLDFDKSNQASVFPLKLALLAVDSSAPPSEYRDVLIEMAHSSHLSELNIKIILHHVHKLRLRNASMAHAVLYSFLSERLLDSDEIAWVEKVLITLLWNTTTSADLSDSPDSLMGILDLVATRSMSSLGTSATHAAQIVCSKIYAQMAYIFHGMTLY